MVLDLVVPLKDMKHFHQLSDKDEKNNPHTIKRRKGNWIGHILRRNCLLKHLIGEKMEGRIDSWEDE